MTPSNQPAAAFQEDLQILEAESELMQAPNQEVDDIATATRNNIVYSKWKMQGLSLCRLAQNASSPRTVDLISKEMVDMVDWVVALMGDMEVSPEQIMLVELSNGVIIDIPCMQRKILFRGNIFFVMSPINVRCGSMDNEAAYWKTHIGEALLFNIIEDPMSLTGTKAEEPNMMQSRFHLQGRERVREAIMEKYPTQGSFLAISPKERQCLDITMLLKLCANQYDIEGDPVKNTEPFAKLAEEIYWYVNQQDQRSQREVEKENSRMKKSAGLIIGAIRAEFGSARDFVKMTREQRKRFRLDDLGLMDIGYIFGRNDPIRNPHDFVCLMADLFGKDDPAVIAEWKRVQR